MKLTTFLPLILAVSTQAASIMPQQSNGEVLHPQQQQQEQNWQHNAQLDSAQGASGSGSREEADISTNWGQGQQQGPQQQPPQQQQQQQKRQSLDFSSEQKGGSQQDTQNSSSSSNCKNDDDLQKLSHAAQALVQKVNDSVTCLAKHLGDTPVTSLKLEQIIHLLQSNSRECLGDISSIKGFPLVGDLLYGLISQAPSRR